MNKFFESLPRGSMISVEKSISVDGFLEVDGQELLKSQHPILFDVLRGNVTDLGESFVLPSKVHLGTYFTDFDPTKMKIIIKF